jgi:outer membrane lipoprotein carrier protein
MKTLSLVAFVTVLAAAPTRGTVHAQSVDATIDRAVAAWAKVKTVRGNFEQIVSNPITASSATAKGKYVQEKPNRLSIRFSDPLTDAIVSDGKAIWIYLPSSTPGAVVKRPATDRSAVPIDPTSQFLDSPRSRYDITAAGTKVVDGHPAHGLQLVAKKGAGAPVAKAIVWVDDDDSLIREFEATEASGVVRHVKLTSVELNVPVETGVFSFTPPRGVKIVDQTKPQ